MISVRGHMNIERPRFAEVPAWPPVIFLAIVFLAIVALSATVATAKRLNAKPVPPIISNGVRYSVEGDGRDQYVVARDVPKDKVLWRVLVFHTRIDPFKEEDVQWVFISELKLVDKTLFIKDEKSRCYTVNLATHEVRKQACVLAP